MLHADFTETSTTVNNPINNSVSHLINHSVNHSINHSINNSLNHASITQSITQSATQSYHSFNNSANHSDNHSVYRSNNHWDNRSVHGRSQFGSAAVVLLRYVLFCYDSAMHSHFACDFNSGFHDRPPLPIPTPSSQFMSLCKNAVRLDDLDADGCRLVFVQEAVKLILSHELASCLCPCMLSMSALHTLRADDCVWQHVMVVVVLEHQS